jgi:ATP phosphoribosyltransferase regulatory subunit
VARLEALLQGARRSGFGEDLIVDLSEVRGMDYYTGIRFEAFAPGLGAALLSGGRYDRLVARFGGDDPAVGWALVVERVLRLERGKAAP